jgi:hypothetical protein
MVTVLLSLATGCLLLAKAGLREPETMNQEPEPEPLNPEP